MMKVLVSDPLSDVGVEIFQETPGIDVDVNIGRIVADRAKGMKMKVIVYDPYIKPETVEKLDLEPVSLDELLQRADYITIHTPKTDETTNMINRETIAKMKKGAMLINCARGGIVNEDDLYEALKSGHLAGAALDVFGTEPPGMIKLMELPNFICTPHLGASTREAQDNVAQDVAEQIVAYLLHGTVKNAVNVPSVSAEMMTLLRPFATLAEKIGLLQTQIIDSGVVEVQINYIGKISEYDTTPLTAAMLKGLLTPILKHDVNFINAPFIAAERGIKVVESKTTTSEDFASLLKVRVKSLDAENVVSGTIFGSTRPRILRINDFYLEAIPEGHKLLISNEDMPGMIGQIATILGDNKINIGQRNIILMNTDVPVNDDVLEKVQALDNVFSARRIEL